VNDGDQSSQQAIVNGKDDQIREGKRSKTI
jgi:hypothetical protein